MNVLADVGKRHNPENPMMNKWEHSLTQACLFSNNYQSKKSQGMMRREKREGDQKQSSRHFYAAGV